jgi:hypothetical protein
LIVCEGCGGSNKTASTGSTLPHGVTVFKPLPPASAATYSVNLAGFLHGAPNGSGLAVISINPSNDSICWRFSSLKNVAAPTVARIFRNFRGASGQNGLALGPTYKASGCVQERALVIQVISARPKEFWVSIHSARFPSGAVRGPLQVGGEAGPSV